MEKEVNEGYLTVAEHKEYVEEVDKRFDKLAHHVDSNYRLTKELSESMFTLTGSVQQLSTKLDGITEKIETRLDATDDKIETFEDNLSDKLILNKENTDLKLSSMERETSLRMENNNGILLDQVRESLAPIENIQIQVDALTNKKEGSLGFKIAIWTAVITSVSTIIVGVISTVGTLMGQ